jgi:hypothetical protein
LYPLSQFSSQNNIYEVNGDFIFAQVTSSSQDISFSNKKNCLIISDEFFTVDPFQIAIGVAFGLLFFKSSIFVFKDDKE